MTNFIQREDGSSGIEGKDYGAGAPVFVKIEYLAASVDKIAYVASRAMRVVGITGRVEAAGVDAGAVTAVVKKAASGTAIASGTALHSGTFNLKGTAATNQELTLSTTSSDLDIPAGTAIGVDFTGVLTTATGAICIALRWA